MTPKRLARLVRFEHALAALRAARPRDLAAFALEAGYADQSHFTREFGEFARVSPARFLDRWRAESPDLALGSHPF